MPVSTRIEHSQHLRLMAIRRWLPVMVVAFLLLLPGALHAQPVPDTLRLSSDRAVELALASGGEAARARIAIARARAGRAQAGGFFPSLPELELEGATDAPFNGNGEGEWEVRLSQEIELNGGRALRRAAADAGIARAELESRAVELAVRAETRIAHARLAAAEESLRLVESQLLFARRLDTIAERQLAVGEISELDRNAVRIERLQVEMERGEREGAVAEARQALAAMLGIAPGWVVGTLGMAPPDTAIVTMLDTLRAADSLYRAEGMQGLTGGEKMIAGRPDLQAIEREMERLRIERDLARSRWLPNITVGLGVRQERTVEPGHPVDESRLLGGHLGIAIPLPITGLYDLGAGDVEAAEAEMAMLETERRMLAVRIRSELGRAEARFRTAERTLQLYADGIVPLAQRNMELLERGYAAGELTATQVITQQGQLLRARESAVRARLELAEAYAELERILAR